MFTIENINTFMNGFCHSPFWDSNLTWYTDNPEFTTCFKKSALVWIPCLFLWIFFPLEIYKLRQSKARDIPFNIFNINKLIVSIILLAICVTNMVKNMILEKSIVPVDIFSPVFQFFTFILFFALTWANLKMGVRSSGILFIFTLLLSICGAPEFRSILLSWQSPKELENRDMHFISYSVYYGSVIILFVLNCFVDAKPRYSLCEDVEIQKHCPSEQASFPSRLFFCWFDSFVWKAYKKPLSDEDFWNLNPEYTSAVVVPKFEKYWNELPAIKMTVMSKENPQDGYHVEYKRSKSTSKVSFLMSIFKMHLIPYLVVIFYLLIENIFIFISPQLLNLLISFVNGNDPLWKGYLYSILFMLTALGQSLILAYYHTKLQIIQMLVRSTLINVVYKKTLTISCQARKHFTTGEIVNLMSSDIRKFTQIIWNFNVLWSAPFQIIGVFFFLWQIFGPSAFSGIVILVAFVPLNSYLSSKLKNLHRLRLQYQDKRVKIMNEILSGIKVLKLYAWEHSFEKQVQFIRNKELKTLREQIGLNITLILLWNIMPYLISLVTFATYVLTGDDHILDARKIFVSVSLFNILKNPLTMLPQVVSEMMQTAVSVTRINKFLNAEELDPDIISHNAYDVPLCIENGSFSWISKEGPPILRNINLKIKEGNLVAIVGQVGSGKSSLLLAFLGEMYKLSGKINTKGSIAYVPQQAWIRNTTLRENIIFANSVEETFYKKILEACALNHDLKILPGGDLTEIGEKGINLSGGQKQRVSLAKALCSDADIYFLDDPLSAVDAQVGNHIFQNVIGPNGMLRNKTRVMVTHSATFLSEMDLIVVLNDGNISEIGTFSQLLNNNGDFAEFLRNYSPEETVEFATKGTDEKKIKQTDYTKKRKKDDSSPTEVIVTNQVAIKKLIKKEHVETGYVKGKVYKNFLISAGWIFPLATLFVFFALQSTIVSSNFWLSKWSTDKNASYDGVQNIEKRDYYLKYYAMFGLLQAILTICGNCTLFTGFLKASTNIHEKLLSNVLKWPMRRFDVTPIGRILNRFSYDIDIVDYTLAMKISKLLLKAGMIISTLFIVSYTTPPFIFICIILLVLFRVMQKFYLATSQQIRRMESNSRSPIYSHFAETVRGLESIRAYGLQDEFISFSQEKVDFNQARVYTSIIASRWSSLRLEAIANSVVFFASLFSVIYRNQLDAGLVGVSVSYSLQITKGFSWLMRTFTEIETLMVAVERIREYEGYQSEAPWEILPRKIPHNWPHVGEIRFIDYKLRYSEDLDLVLKGITFHVKGGEKIGIVGRTGAGKSSLALGLFRIIEPAGGSIYIDNIDISSLGLHDLRSRLTIIPQDPVLFSGTLRINLDPFDNYTDEALWNVLELAHLKNYFSSPFKGLQYDIDEGGVNLSVGQRQLICLARALLRKTKILVLDEATAAIDLETDDLIQATIRREFSTNTVLTIAHRLNTIMDYDKILVLNNGVLVEYDTPQSLLQITTSTFHEMAREAGLI